jgi:hypothetical protein
MIAMAARRLSSVDAVMIRVPPIDILSKTFLGHLAARRPRDTSCGPMKLRCRTIARPYMVDRGFEIEKNKKIMKSK